MSLFLYGYWLRDALALGDEQMIALTAGIAALAAVAYLVVLNWTFPRLIALGARSAYGLVLAGIPVTAFVLFGGTSNWTLPDRYLDFLLPDHHLQLSISPPEAAPGSGLTWFNTSIGDVSYATVSTQGWQRIGDELIVQDPSSNVLSWTGDVGDKVQIVFNAAENGMKATVSWDGAAETIVLSKGKSNYSREFAVPLYASQTAIMTLGFVSIFALALALCVLIWARREDLANSLFRQLANSSMRLRATDLWFLAMALIVAALLRVINLASVFPAVDEYYHLIAAKQIVEGAGLGAVYPRGLWLVTLPVALAFRIFGYQLWAARLVGAIFNVLAIIPLYLLSRKINQAVAALASLLYATSPWIVSFARVAREYAYYPFYFFWIVYAMVLFIEGIPQRFVVARDWREVARPRMLLLAACLLLPPPFALRIDWLSTFRTILISYLVFGGFLMLRLDWRNRSNWPILAVVGAGIITSGRSWYIEQSSKLLLVPQVNPQPIEYFLPNPQQQWYFDRVVVLVALAILAAVVAACLIWRRNFIPAFAVALLVSYLAVFALLSRTFFHTRHLLSTELWYVIVVAVGLYVVWLTLAVFLPRTATVTQLLLALGLGLCVVNLGQITKPMISTDPDMPISEDYMHDMSQVQTLLLASARPGDVLVSTVYGQYALWTGDPVFAQQLRITSHTPIDDVLAYAAQHPSGWIVVDEIRFKLASMSVKDLAGHDQIEYVGLFGDEHVWRWDRISSQIGVLSSREGGR